MLVGPGVEVYEGMIVGENARADEMDVNPTKEKQLTNHRAAGSDDLVRLVPPRCMSLEQALEFITDDECVEVTPKNVRLRKVLLSAERPRPPRNAEAAEVVVACVGSGRRPASVATRASPRTPRSRPRRPRGSCSIHQWPRPSSSVTDRAGASDARAAAVARAGTRRPTRRARTRAWGCRGSRAPIPCRRSTADR